MYLESPAIAPVSEGVERPFWSVMIPTYNCADYLEETLKSVLEQAPSPEEMQIEVIDDCSTKDDPEAVVKRIGKGRVSFYRQPQNVGAQANFTTCIQRATGYWVHILHGDDMIIPGFYQAYRQIIETYKCSMVVAQAILMDEKGQYTGVSQPLDPSSGLLSNALEVLAKDNPIRTPAVVAAREAYEKVGGFNPMLVHSNDWEMWTRLAAFDAVGYVEKPYALYRIHPGSDTNKLALSAVQITDSLKALKIIQSRFSEEKERKEIQSCVYQRKAASAYFKSRTFARKGYFLPALLSAFWAIRLSPSFRALINMIYVAALSGVRSFSNTLKLRVKTPI